MSQDPYFESGLMDWKWFFQHFDKVIRGDDAPSGDTGLFTQPMSAMFAALQNHQEYLQKDKS